MRFLCYYYTKRGFIPLTLSTDSRKTDFALSEYFLELEDITVKKLISVVLSGAIMASCLLTASAADKFSDFSKDKYDWAYSQVMDMVDRGYITGYDDNTFKPDNSVTRLEVLALFSRAMGALDEANEEVLKKAVDTFGETLKPYGLTWGTDEICFLLYRDVLSVDDLNTYLKDKLKNEAMPRYEAAIIITKAMGGQKSATSSQSVTLDFSDQKDIPSNALQYVKFVSDNGVMTGMEDGTFSPNTSVLRSQMAVMLSRMVNKMDYTIVTGKLSEVDTNGRIVSMTDKDGDIVKYTYLANVLMKVDGVETSPKYMTVGVSAIVTLSNNKVAYIDTLSSVPDEQISGTFQARSTSGSVTRITIRKDGDTTNTSYECSPSVSVTYNDSPSSLTNFKQYDYVKLELVDGKVEKIMGETKETTITNAVISDISLEPEFTMTITHAKEEYDGNTYPIADDVTVIKNNDTADFSSVYVGDRVTLTLNYGKITGIKATSTSKTLEGTIKSINISQMPSIVVNVNGEDREFAVATGVSIKINGDDGTLYDFRVGDVVKITLESETVTKISASSAQSTTGKIDGVVTAVNSAYGFIKVSYRNSDNYTIEETVYCKDGTTTILTEAGAAKKVKDIAVGQTVTVHGSQSNGAFVAKIIIIGG